MADSPRRSSWNSDGFRETRGAEVVDDLEQRHAAGFPRRNPSVNPLGNPFHYPEESQRLEGVSKTQPEAPNAFAGRLMAWRQASGLSQKAAAKVLGVTPGYISKLERGVQTPAYSAMARIDATISGSSERLQVADRPPEYEMRGEARRRLTASDLPIASKALGGCEVGDTVIFSRAREPWHGALALSPAGELGVITRHPVLSRWMLWTPSSEDPQSGEGAPIAVALIRSIVPPEAAED